jgi:hypothetical protein
MIATNTMVAKKVVPRSNVARYVEMQNIALARKNDPHHKVCRLRRNIYVL